MPVRLLIEDGPYAGVSRADVLRRARAMLQAIELVGSELSIVLTGDEQIHELNRSYRKMDRPTDVLAFALREGQDGEHAGRLLGDVVVSIPTARRQAEGRGADLTSELTMLLAHGLLHLVGWDHDTVAKDRRMRRETARLCASADAAAHATLPANGRARARAKRVPGEASAPPSARANRESIARKASRTAR